jgi:hypothetical protein
MKIFKIILAVVLAYSAISSFLTLAGTEKGAGLFGVFIGCSLLLVGAVFLFRSAIKTK